MKALEILKLIEQGNSIPKLNEKYINEAISELEALETKESCATCKKKLLCKKAENIKLNWGFKLSEMWFNCWESK